MHSCLRNDGSFSTELRVSALGGWLQEALERLIETLLLALHGMDILFQDACSLEDFILKCRQVKPERNLPHVRDGDLLALGIHVRRVDKRHRFLRQSIMSQAGRHGGGNGSPRLLTLTPQVSVT